MDGIVPTAEWQRTRSGSAFYTEVSAIALEPVERADAVTGATGTSLPPVEPC